ncbi:Hypothetical protein KVN_LOCUS518 [uncultured virus]|nr:Hypothetical protein KVN_LOCUS518 [uncultured virus]
MSKNIDIDLNKISVKDNIKEKNSSQTPENGMDVIALSQIDFSIKEKDISKKLVDDKNKPILCFFCNKKTGIINYKCKCNNIFCNKHRHSFEHNCEFDYKTDNKNKLKESLQKIVANKIDKI